MKKPCLDCGTPTGTTRCDGCRATFDKARGVNTRRDARRRHQGGRPQYRGGYQKAAEGVRAVNVCWICGQPGTTDDPMQADHLIPAAINPAGTGGGGLAPAHRSCNIRRAHAIRRAQRRAAEKAELDRRLNRDW